jgi:hypothetical protein
MATSVDYFLRLSVSFGILKASCGSYERRAKRTSTGRCTSSSLEGESCPTLRIRVTPGCPYSGPTIIRCELLVSGFPPHVRVHIAYWFLMGITLDQTGNRRPAVLDGMQGPGVACLTRRPAACINNTTDGQGRFGPLPVRFSFLQISEAGVGQAFEIKAHDLRGDGAQNELGHVNPRP